MRFYKKNVCKLYKRKLPAFYLFRRIDINYNY